MGKDYRPKTQYIHKNEPEFYKFKDHEMIKFAFKINPNTDYGEAMSLGVSKCKGMIDNIELLKAFVKEHDHECRTISDTAHLDKKEEKKKKSDLNSSSEVNEEDIPF